MRNRCRISRNKKQYWKRGTKIQDEAEDFLHQATIDKNDDGLLWEQKDENLFSIDREPDNSATEKLTRRQMAALMKRIKKKESAEYEENGVSKRQMKRSFPKKPKKETERKKVELTKSIRSEARKPYDLWGEQGNLQNECSIAEEHYLRVTKKKLPREPKTLKHITSVLPHVEVDAAGASYNPPLSKYLDYVAEAAREAAVKMKEIEKMDRQLALKPGQKYVTEEELEAELRSGLDESAETVIEIETEETQANSDGGEKIASKREIKPKTRKARRKERLEKKRKQLKSASKFRKEQMHTVFSARKLNKEISEEARKQQEMAAKRKAHKLLKRFAGTQRLGRGKFEPCEKPVLLVDELPGSLREVKPQGSIIAERLKSWQKRNMLPIPGEKSTRKKLKRRLRYKEKEDRKFQEVKPGSRLI